MIRAINFPFLSAVIPSSEDQTEMEAAWAVQQAASLVLTTENHLNVADVMRAMFYQGLSAAVLGMSIHIMVPAQAVQRSIPAASSAVLIFKQVLLNAQPVRWTQVISSPGTPAATATTCNTLTGMVVAKHVEKFWLGA